MPAPNRPYKVYKAIEAFRNPPLEASKASNRLIFYINKVSRVKRLYILGVVVKDILTIVYTVEGYIGFARCYECIVGL